MLSVLGLRELVAAVVVVKLWYHHVTTSRVQSLHPEPQHCLRQSWELKCVHAFFKGLGPRL